MDSFQEYIKSEFKDINIAATEFKYSYYIGKNEKYKNNYINVTIKCYNNDMKLLKSLTLKFINNTLSKTCSKKLINISADELNNKFLIAKNDIINIIQNEYKEKLNEITSKINLLKDYAAATERPEDLSSKSEAAGIRSLREAQEVKTTKHVKFNM